ncbi:MAG: hypothetical protein IK121_07510 [Lachnospiraceae bacterium]|nr:hypothetical protein [Lachnospiraceae bacterium]
MENNVLIWAEEVYKNDFRCDYCLEKIMDVAEDEEAIHGIFAKAMGQTILVCPTCGRVVAVETKSDEYGIVDSPRLVGEVDIPSELRNVLATFLSDSKKVFVKLP